ncbi:MAG: sugar ABC transporter permease [Chloroflexi bacterium]|nr:sugar ABC transporter permease [Chloroflexota bacterium]
MPHMTLRRLLNDKNITIVAFLLPALVLYGTFVIIPIFQSFRFSLYHWDGLGPLTRFIGLENYATLLHDETFWQALRNNFALVGFSLVTQLPPAVLLAVLLTGAMRGRDFFRTMFFSPQILSAVATGYLFYYIYEPTFGLLNQALKLLGLGTLARGWLGDQMLALPAVLVVISWRHIGFYMVLFMAAIEGIPDEIFEAAQIDGCNKRQLVWHITLPLMSGAIRTAAVLAMVGSIKYFDLIWIMTRGGPVHASELIATYMYKETFLNWHMGYGATLAFALFVVAFAVSLLFLRLTSRGERAEEAALAAM